MINWVRTHSLALLLVGLMAWPAAGGVYLVCADGTPCSLPIAAEASGCCAPAPCYDQPAVPDDDRCVVKAEAERVFVAPAAPPDLTALRLQAVLPLASDAADDGTTFVVVPTRDERPPPFLAAKQGRSPRSPPGTRA